MKWALAILMISWLTFAADAQSNWAIAAIQPVGSNAVEIAWPSDTNHWYRLEQSTNLLEGVWDTVYPSTLATAPTNHYTNDLASTVPVFWRAVADTADYYSNVVATGSGETLITFGTTNRDWISQSALSGSNTMFIGGDAGSDWIEQYGGADNDTMSIDGGTGDDSIYQDGGPGDDSLASLGGMGDDSIVQCGDAGDDVINAGGGEGEDQITVSGGEGNDTVYCDGGSGSDTIAIDGDGGEDTVTYNVGEAQDSAVIDGGPDDDTVTIYGGAQSFAVYDGFGSLMYEQGTNGSTITVRNVEHGTINGNDANPVYTW
jgi:hypothetical protein